MKTLFPIFTVSVLVLASGCMTHSGSKSQADSETVLITYYPAAGNDKELESTLAHAWQVYQKNHMVYDEPHTIVRGDEGQGKSYYVEVFTWKKSPNHPTVDVSAVWSHEQSLCEPRDGHKGIEGGPVQPVPTKS